MSPKIIHFDIRPGKGIDIDLVRMFPMTEAHPLRDRSVEFFVDDMKRVRTVLDFSLPKRIELTRFSTLSTLDLALRMIIDPEPWQQKILGLASRPHTLNLVPPLDLPHAPLDIRNYATLPKKNTYSDIYTRRLPYSLMVKRTLSECLDWLLIHRRGIVGVLLTFLITTIPILFFIKYSIESGYEKLISLSTHTAMSDIRDTIDSARDDFERANFLFFPFSWIPGETMDIVERATQGGRFMTRGMSQILDTIPIHTGATFSLARSDISSHEFRPGAQDIFLLESIGIETPTDWIDKNSAVINSAFIDLSRAGDIYEHVATGSELAAKMHDVGVLLSRGMKYFTYGITHKEQLLEFLGHNEPIRYLVLNQNRDEIRANGGFPGSVIIFTLYKGNILDLRRDDVYYYDWNLYPYKEQPPPGLALLTENYGLRDVNYYPDFRLTLEKANNFIERSGDSTITSGIAIHQGLVEDMLKYTGPITVSGVTLAFDNENFSLLMSTLVENQFAREHHPKDILFQFGDALIAKIHEKRLYESVFDLIEQYWKNGEILFASRDQGMDDTIAHFRKNLPWECGGGINYKGGTISSENNTSYLIPHTSPQCSPNWIYPIFTSISGNKSDRYIVRRYESSTKKLKDCTYENVVTLSLTHTYNKQDTETIRSYMDILGIKEKSEREKLEFIEGNGKNRAFTRLYVPKSTTLGFTGSDVNISENENAKVFSFILEANPGSTTSKTLRYTVDIPDCSSDSLPLEWTRQPGIRELTIQSSN